MRKSEGQKIPEKEIVKQKFEEAVKMNDGKHPNPNTIIRLQGIAKKYM